MIFLDEAITLKWCGVMGIGRFRHGDGARRRQQLHLGLVQFIRVGQWWTEYEGIFRLIVFLREIGTCTSPHRVPLPVSVFRACRTPTNKSVDQ